MNTSIITPDGFPGVAVPVNELFSLVALPDEGAWYFELWVDTGERQVPVYVNYQGAAGSWALN